LAATGPASGGALVAAAAELVAAELITLAAVGGALAVGRPLGLGFRLDVFTVGAALPGSVVVADLIALGTGVEPTPGEVPAALELRETCAPLLLAAGLFTEATGALALPFPVLGFAPHASIRTPLPTQSNVPVGCRALPSRFFRSMGWQHISGCVFAALASAEASTTDL
jgi:hypothetical protein